ncbi:MAG: endonuclease domain-containing protein [Bacteroidota bacterium]|nr:endonuclease domain-containing protein [Bacteroidota bacterium]
MKELEKYMYFKAKAETLGTARLLRKNLTYYEKLIWEKLKGKQIPGYRFRRQHPIDFFIVDFYCHEVMLVVELDGEIHNHTQEYDDGRSAEMEKYGIKVIRFTNKEVEENIESVIKRIKKEVLDRLKSPPWGI